MTEVDYERGALNHWHLMWINAYGIGRGLHNFTVQVKNDLISVYIG